MDISRTVASQFNAALSMMEQTVKACPEELWNVPGEANPFWRVAYHALFYVDLYMQPSEDEMKLWENARDGYQFLGPTPWPPHEQPQADQPYSPEEILAYIEHLRSFVASTVPTVDLSAPSGFHWLPFDKLELQIYNIRHLQQHIGDLSTILLTQANREIDWVGMG
ncbi:MAG: DinB family protein [Caldilineaceae bacterium SB0668_bin_21]|nr:DinB family protein [Caldilineaceae bacterium SB0668_bin_21]MYC22629.1 DinB family protein [Caldilineaceae bacterium SB0662_bin_25]